MSIENPQSVHDFPIATSMYKRFFIAIFPDRRVKIQSDSPTSRPCSIAWPSPLPALAGRRLRSKHLETAEDVGGLKTGKPTFYGS